LVLDRSWQEAALPRFDWTKQVLNQIRVNPLPDCRQAGEASHPFLSL
jgi:hypothetical protein